MTRLVLDRTATPPSDIVAFDAVWDSMHLVRLALNLKGIYVNNKAKGVDDFLEDIRPRRGGGRGPGDLDGLGGLGREVQSHTHAACAWARRLDALTRGLAAELFVEK